MRRLILLSFLVFAFGCSDHMVVEPLDEPSEDLIITAAPQDRQEKLFRDDFEDGDAQGWDLWDPWGSGSWSIEAENGNHVLSASTAEGPAFARVQHPGWYDFVFKSRIKFVDGNVYCELIVRSDIWGRHYWVQVMDNHVGLAKEGSTGQFWWLAAQEMSFVQDVWYEFKIVVNHKRIIVIVDGSQMINFRDDYMWRRNGTVGFEVHDNTHVLFDDVFGSGSSAGN